MSTTSTTHSSSACVPNAVQKPRAHMSAPSPTLTPASMSAPAPVRLAVFDLDGTLINGQSGQLFAYYLYKRDLLSHRDVLRLMWWATRYLFHLPYTEQEARAIIFGMLVGRPKQEVLELMRAFHDEMILPRYRARGLAEIKARKQEGCYTLLVSATFKGIADFAGAYLGVDHVIATDMACDEKGCYTKEVEGDVCAGEEKTKQACAWADAHLGPGAWVLAYAYGDHHSDKNLLATSEVPFAISPGFVLKHIARKYGWSIENWKRSKR